MNEKRYDKKHLKPYQGVLTSEVQNGRFKMELKVEDNDVLKRSEKIESSIELDFKYDYSFSPQFFHNIHSCQTENCSKCEEVRSAYYRYELDIIKLQLGDTCEIKAALVNNNCSELPREIRDFKAYGTLLVASPEYYQGPPRLRDTKEGANIKREYFEKKEREAEEEVRKAEEEAQRLKKLHEEPFFNKLLDKLSPYVPGWLVKGVIVTFIGGLMVYMFGESIKNFILGSFR